MTHDSAHNWTPYGHNDASVRSGSYTTTESMAFLIENYFGKRDVQFIESYFGKRDDETLGDAMERVASQENAATAFAPRGRMR